MKVRNNTKHFSWIRSVVRISLHRFMLSKAMRLDKMEKLFLIVAVLFAAVCAENFTCPEDTGSFPDPVQCDKYYECKNGTVTERLCEDGLVFDQKINRTGKCDQPFSVECGDRKELQPPQGNSTHCLRKNGIYKHPDETICDIFYICVDGLHTEEKCMAPLVFDEATGTCTWVDVAARETCVDKKKVLKDGFECPKADKFDKNGQIIVHPQYEHPNDCTKFYVCINGNDPREVGCENLDEVYNHETKLCDKPQNVPGCEDWFDVDDPEE